MKYPALDVSDADGELVLAVIDECSPTAVETDDTSLTIFFTNRSFRDCARRAIESAFPSAITRSREVDDGDWARRSQESLTPVTVGRITITSPWFKQSPAPSPQPLVIVIAPSMGFGTGHHATTKLCLTALQKFDTTGAVALDIGTGSGVLAIAARMLGAREVLGIDHDPDAIDSARDNLVANPRVDHVRFEVADLQRTALPAADIVTANLTGAVLIRSAPLLLSALTSSGVLVVSGLLTSERAEVLNAFSPARLLWEGEDDGWGALGFGL